MHKLILVVLSFLLINSIFSQDFLLLKKRNKTIASFYIGNAITFRTTAGNWVDAYINKITNDTLYIKEFELVRYVNSWGMPSVDTMWRNRRKITIKDMSAFPRQNQSVNYIKDGTIFQVGAGGYILLNVINTLSDGDNLFENNNGSRLGIAALVFIIGTLMHTSRSPVIEIGKKYTLKYIKMQEDK
ncbi:MAG: hypothetical protein ABI861_00805 [Panacibacter sp.]